MNEEGSNWGKAVQKVPNRRGAPQIGNWTLQRNMLLIRLLSDHYENDFVNGSFTRTGWLEILQEFNSESGLTHVKEQLQNRSKNLKKDYNAFIALINRSRWVWDDRQKCPLPYDDSAWDELPEHLKKLRWKTFPYYKELEVIVRRETARGVNATSSMRHTENDEFREYEGEGDVNLSQMEFSINDNATISSQTPIMRNNNNMQEGPSEFRMAQDPEVLQNVIDSSPSLRSAPNPSENTLRSSEKHRRSGASTSNGVEKMATMMEEFLMFSKSKRLCDFEREEIDNCVLRLSSMLPDLQIGPRARMVAQLSNPSFRDIMRVFLQSNVEDMMELVKMVVNGDV